MAMVWWLVGLLLPTLATGQQRFLNTETTTKYAAIGLVEPSVGVTRVIGTVKRSEEPLMQQTEKWEARCDNGYPNVLHNPNDPHGEFRLWYGCFTSGSHFATGQGSVRSSISRLRRYVISPAVSSTIQAGYQLVPAGIPRELLHSNS